MFRYFSFLEDLLKFFFIFEMSSESDIFIYHLGTVSSFLFFSFLSHGLNETLCKEAEQTKSASSEGIRLFNDNRMQTQKVKNFLSVFDRNLFLNTKSTH